MKKAIAIFIVHVVLIFCASAETIRVKNEVELKIAIANEAQKVPTQDFSENLAAQNVAEIKNNGREKSPIAKIATKIRRLVFPAC